MITVLFFFFAVLNTCIGTGLFDLAPWNTLRVTYGPPNDTNAFSPMPLTASDAVKQGFTKISSRCSGTFNGNRYIKGRDLGVILLYDVNGYIAGLQTALPKSIAQPQSAYYSFDTSVVYQQDQINGQDVYVLTAYFVDPEIICTTGRSDAEVKSQGTGSDLYIRNGTSLLKMPHIQAALANTKWTKGGCVVDMGRHYFYNIRNDMPSQDFFPFFLLYNRGMLTGFGFVMIGDYKYSSRYEYPTEADAHLFLNPVPDFVYRVYQNAGGFTTLHVYFNVNPLNLKC